MKQSPRSAQKAVFLKTRIKKDCLAILSGMSSFSWEKYTAALEAKGNTVKLKMDASVAVRGYTIQSGNSVYKSSVIGRDLTPSRIQETWEKMRPENRFEQMTPDEQMTFILSDEGADFRFKFSIDVEGKKYPISVPGKAVRVFNDESVRFIMDNPRDNNPGILKAAFLLFAGYVDAATTIAQNCGGGGSAPRPELGPRQKRGRHSLGTPLPPQGAGDSHYTGDKVGKKEMIRYLILV